MRKNTDAATTSASGAQWPSGRTDMRLADDVAMLLDLRSAEDVLLRFAHGQDSRDKALFESAFAEDAVMDFMQPARKFGIDLGPFEGRADVQAVVFRNIAELDTSHTVTNQRIRICGDRALGTALVEAQHIVRMEPNRRLMLKNLYRIELVRAPGGWEATRMVIENIWSSGEPSVLFPSA